jgi:hypothetical protein
MGTGAVKRAVSEEASYPHKGSVAFVWWALVLGVTLRLAGVWNDLWLDEIWSLRNVEHLTRALDIFTIHDDNNHLVNSLLMFALGSGAHAATYRLGSLVAGCCSLIILAFAASRSHRLGEKVTLLLYALSLPCIVYDSEARGYALGTTCALLTYSLNNSFMTGPSLRRAVLLWPTAILGMCAHFSFLPYYAALVAWSVGAAAVTQQHNLRRTRALLLTAHGVPLCGAMALYLTTVRYLPTGSGTLAGYADVVLSTLSLAAGGLQLSASDPESSLLAVLVAVGFLALMLRELYDLRREGTRAWSLYAVLIFGVPAVILLVLQPRVVFPRYFLPSIVCSYYLCGKIVQRRLAGSRGGAICAVAVTFACLVAHALSVTTFLRHGRGEYSAALTEMARVSGSQPLTVASDHDFRNGLVVRYHAERLGLAGKINYLERDASGAERSTAATAPDWYIAHESEPSAASPPPSITIGNSNHYLLYRTYGHGFGLLSGWSWHLYRHSPD